MCLKWSASFVKTYSNVVDQQCSKKIIFLQTQINPRNCDWVIHIKQRQVKNQNIYNFSLKNVKPGTL